MNPKRLIVDRPISGMMVTECSTEPMAPFGMTAASDRCPDGQADDLRHCSSTDIGIGNGQRQIDRMRGEWLD